MYGCRNLTINRLDFNAIQRALIRVQHLDHVRYEFLIPGLSSEDELIRTLLPIDIDAD